MKAGHLPELHQALPPRRLLGDELEVEAGASTDTWRSRVYSDAPMKPLCLKACPSTATAARCGDTQPSTSMSLASSVRFPPAVS